MKNNKGFAPIAIVLIVIAVLAIGGIAYYVGTKNNSVPQNTQENNNQPPANQNNTTNTPVVNSNTTNTSFAILSPKEGDNLVIGQTYKISFSQELLSDYNTITLANAHGTAPAMICPDLRIKKGESTFNWIAGRVFSSCSETDNSSIIIASPGITKIFFYGSNRNGDKIQEVTSGVFNLVAQ